MNTDYQPGTVAVATVRGFEGERVFRTNGIGGADAIWFTAEFVRHERVHGANDVTDVRPLVVLDAEPEELRGFLECARAYDTRIDPTAPSPLSRIADQIEAQTKPPRIPEPGLWGVVSGTYENRDVHEFTRVRFGGTAAEWIDANGHFAYWEKIADPTLIREGVES